MVDGVSGEIDIAASEKLQVNLWKVMTHDGYDVCRTEKARSDRGIRSRPSKKILLRGFLGFDIVDGNRSGYENTHKRKRWRCENRRKKKDSDR